MQKRRPMRMPPTIEKQNPIARVLCIVAMPDTLCSRWLSYERVRIDDILHYTSRKAVRESVLERLCCSRATRTSIIHSGPLCTHPPDTLQRYQFSTERQRQAIDARHVTGQSRPAVCAIYQFRLRGTAGKETIHCTPS